MSESKYGFNPPTASTPKTVIYDPPDPLEPLRKAVRSVLLTPGASARFDWQAIEREAARLVLRELRGSAWATAERECACGNPYDEHGCAIGH